MTRWRPSDCDRRANPGLETCAPSATEIRCRGMGQTSYSPPCSRGPKPAICARRTPGPKTWRQCVSEDQNRDRSLHLDHPQRPQAFHRARGVRAALHRAFGGHRQGRAVQAGVPQDQPQQPDPGDRRSRQRHRADGVGRDPDLPRRQDRQVPAARRRGALPRDRVADVADGRPGTDVRPGASLHQVQSRQGALCRGALPQGGAPALRRARQAARDATTTSAATTRSPTWRSGRGCRATSGRPSISTSIPTSSAGTSPSPTRPAVQKGYKVPKDVGEVPIPA